MDIGSYHNATAKPNILNGLVRIIMQGKNGQASIEPTPKILVATGTRRIALVPGRRKHEGQRTF